MNHFDYYLDQWIGRFHHLRRNYNKTVPPSKKIRHTKEDIYLEIARRCIEKMNQGEPKELCFQWRSSRVNLGARIEVSESSVYRGLKILEEAGFIKVAFKGRELGFDIFVNPQLFFDSGQDHPFYLNWEKVDKSTQSSFLEGDFIQASFGFKLIYFKNLACFMSERPQLNIKEKLENKNSREWISPTKKDGRSNPKHPFGIHQNVKDVSKTSLTDKAQDNRSEWVDWYLKYLIQSGRINRKGNQQNKFAKLCFANLDKAQDNEKEGSGLYQKRFQPNFEKQSIHKLLTPAQASILEHAQHIWKVANQYLYPHFTKESVFYEYQIINQIIDVIELEYLPLKRIKTFQEYSKEFCQRIVMVSCYLERYAGEKYLPSPVNYFNPRNSRGFVGTRKWLLDKQDRKAQNKIAYQKQRLLQRIEKSFIENKLEGVAASALQIYRYFEKQVNSFQDPSMQKSYDKMAQRFCVNRF